MVTIQSSASRMGLEAKLLHIVTRYDRRAVSRIVDRITEDLDDAQAIKAEYAAFVEAGEPAVSASGAFAHLT